MFNTLESAYLHLQSVSGQLALKVLETALHLIATTDVADVTSLRQRLFIVELNDSRARKRTSVN